MSSFPTVATLQDDFNRADANPISAGPLGWTYPMGFPSGLPDPLGISSNQVYSPLGTSATCVTTTRYGADIEAYITVPVVPTALDSRVYLWVRVQNPGTDNFCAYGITYGRYGSGEYDLVLVRDDNGSDTGLDSIFNTSPVPFSNGLKIGISCVGNQISGHYDTGGGWTTWTTRTDSTYSAGGPVALFMEGNVALPRFDDLYVGTVGGIAPGRIDYLGAL